MQPVPTAEFGDRQTKARERRDERQRRETWERACKQMPDVLLLRTLGELHIKYEDGYAQLHQLDPAKESQRHQEVTQHIEFVEEQLSGARQVWMNRRKALKQPAAELTQEVVTLQGKLSTSREQLAGLSTTSTRHAEERLKIAILSEQSALVEYALAMASRKPAK